jgi:hypothetical protein
VAEPFDTLLSTRWSWLTIFLASFLLFFLFFLIMSAASVHPWSDITQDRITGYHHEQCEVIKPTSFFLQVWNFWSNFAYLLVGLMVLLRAASNAIRFIGIVFIFLALGSAYFHGTITGLGQTIDIMGVYVALIALIAYALIVRRRLNETLYQFDDTEDITAPIYLILSVVIGVLTAIYRTSAGPLFDSSYFTPALVLILLGLSIWFCLEHDSDSDLLLPGILALVFGAFACIFKFTDGTDNLFASHNSNLAACTYSSTGFIQGHALWHVLSAFMFLCVIEFLRSIHGDSDDGIFPWAG